MNRSILSNTYTASLDDSGNNIRVADIWESEQDLDNFVNSGLKPVMERLNIPMPKSECRVHNVNAYTGVNIYKARITEKGNPKAEVSASLQKNSFQWPLEILLKCR